MRLGQFTTQPLGLKVEASALRSWRDAEDTPGGPEALQLHKVLLLLEKEMETHPSILAWEIPWTKEPGGWAAVHAVAK